MAVVRKTSGAPTTGMKISGDLPRLANPLKDAVSKWINIPARFFAFKDEIRAIPPGTERLLNLITKHLYIVNAGTLVGTAKQNKVVPAHAAAMSVNLDQDLWARLDVDYETAVRYLRKESIDASALPRGFALVRYQNLPLGWLNVLDTRSNNLYPSEWRIRAQSSAEEKDPE